MSKQYNIRWTESDNVQLRKTVKNFNAKISRLERKYPEIKNVLPEKVSVEQMKELIDTRKDLKRELNALKRFSDRTNIIRKESDGSFTGIKEVPGSKYNLKATDWQIKEMTRRIGYINKVRKQKAEQIGSLDMLSRGKKLGYTKIDIGMGTVDENALKPMKAFFPSMTRQDFNKRYTAIRKERQIGYWMKKELQLKQNVINGILANYNADEFKDDIKELLNAIDRMSFNEFYDRFMGEVGVMELVSPPPGSDMMEQLRINMNALKSTWIPNYAPKKITKKKLKGTKSNKIIKTRKK